MKLRFPLPVLTTGILALVLLVVAGCYPPAVTPAPAAPPVASPATAPAASTTITGIVWQWASVTNQSTKQTDTVSNPENYTITFNTDGTLTGKADCNNFAGSYSQQNGFTIKLGASTMAYCGDASLDQKYLQLLGSVAAGGPDGQGNLALETAGGEQRMLFKNGGAAPAPVPTSAPATSNTITGVVWQWNSLTNQTTKAVETISNPENYTITFNTDGTLTGKADCNTFSGTYTQTNGFSITLGASTRAYCGDASLDQRYLQLLGSVAAGGPDGQGNLALETAGGEQRMLFKNGGPAPK